MDFYADLSPYYEAIFPLTGDKVKLTERYVPAGGRVLDVGCSTGELVLALAQAGYHSAGIDLSEEMIEKARAEAAARGLDAGFRMGDMRELRVHFSGLYDGITCFGNTIVHITDIREIRQFFRQIYAMLQPQGSFLFQIVNYDRILAKGITELPLIENPEKRLKFYRHYDYDKAANLIHFQTRLVVDGEEVEHTVPLYPLTSDEIKVMLSADGFRNPRFFGDFAEHPYDPERSGAFVVIVQK